MAGGPTLSLWPTLLYLALLLIEPQKQQGISPFTFYQSDVTLRTLPRQRRLRG